MLRYGLILVIFILASQSAFAQEKIATVNLQKALNMVEEGKKTMEGIKNDAAAKQKQLESMKAELKTMRDDVEKQKMVLSKEVLQQKMNEIQAKFLELQQKASQFDQDLKKREGEGIQKIIVALKPVAIQVAQQEKCTMLYENSAETILFAANSIDITDKVIQAYNRRK